MEHHCNRPVVSDNGWIFSVYRLRPSLYPALETSALRSWTLDGKHPSIFRIQYRLPQYRVSPQNAGTANFNFTVIDDYGCAQKPGCHNCPSIFPPQLLQLLGKPESGARQSIICNLHVDVSTGYPYRFSLSLFEAVAQEPFGNGKTRPR